MDWKEEYERMKELYEQERTWSRTLWAKVQEYKAKEKKEEEELDAMLVDMAAQFSAQ